MNEGIHLFIYSFAEFGGWEAARQERKQQSEEKAAAQLEKKAGEHSEGSRAVRRQQSEGRQPFGKEGSRAVRRQQSSRKAAVSGNKAAVSECFKMLKLLGRVPVM